MRKIKGLVKVAPLPAGKFAVIYADPCWDFSAGKKGRPQHYARMSIKEIADLPVQDIAADDCWLFLWITGPHLVKGSHLPIIKAWGFKPSAMGFDWIKLNKKSGTLFTMLSDYFQGQGYTTRKNAEYCLLCRKGKPKRLSRKVQALIVSQIREHSRKPDEIYDRIEQFAPGPYVELFARTERKGWASWGNEKDKFK